MGVDVYFIKSKQIFSSFAEERLSGKKKIKLVSIFL